MIRLVQLNHKTHGRAVAVVEEPVLRLLSDVASVYELCQKARNEGATLAGLVERLAGRVSLNYESVYAGQDAWKLSVPFDHPTEPARCLVTGTGLTHKASAEQRQTMHAADKDAVLTDSMKMYRSGLQGGRPAPGKIGAQPEWFYKGNGTILRAHGEPLEIPSYGLDGGEEAEVAGVYFVDAAGQPRRVGFVLANEFSDHVLEKQNYLYLAHSKLRTCSIGPELIVDNDFREARGTVQILRGPERKSIWSGEFATGEKNMSHTVANLEHHHFKHAGHRRPGDVHVHFFGADVFSFSGGCTIQDGDVIQISLPGFGRALINPVQVDRSEPTFFGTRPV
jgi:hypothetical protein